MCQVIRA